MSQPIEQRRKLKRQKNDIDASLEADKQENQIQPHPLCIELVLKNLFGHLKNQVSQSTLANYRRVCKVWNQEIVKLIRKDTQINLTNILAPYPDGLGWTPSPQNLEVPYYYEAPYPEVYSFTNVLVEANSCEVTQNQKWIDWFRVMGSEIKHLSFSSSLTCFCQNNFLEQILKEWCPNLVCLELCNVKCINSLLLVSGFTGKHTTLNCNYLKTLKISVTGNVHFSLCPQTHNADLSMVLIQSRQFCMRLAIKTVSEAVNNHVYTSKSPVQFPEIVNFSDGKVVLPLQRFQSGNENEQNMSEILIAMLECTDGGIMAKLMKEVNIQKLEINCLDEQKENFATFFHLRPNKWRLTLKELKLSENFVKSFKELLVIATVKFPLTTIKLNRAQVVRHNQHMTVFLSYFSDTLENLEITGPVVKQEVARFPGRFNLPVLPKLKKIVHENISACSLLADNLWRKAPNLETCFLERGSTMAWDANDFFENSLRISSNAMKEFRLLAPISGRQAELVLDWFPNLVKLELVLESIGSKSLGFFEKMEKSKVDELKVAFLGYLKAGLRLRVNYRSPLFWKVGNIKGLTYLELDNETNLPLHIGSKPFSEVKLTSLKLYNFRMFCNEKDKVMKNLSHIPSVELVNTEYVSKGVRKGKK